MAWETLEWKGYKWLYLTQDADYFFVDEDDNLHYVDRYIDGVWYGNSYNKYLADNDGNQASWHYGTYAFTIANDLGSMIDGGFPDWIFAPFLYDNNLPHGGEMDIEITKFGYASYPFTCFWTNYGADPAGDGSSIFHTAVPAIGPNVTYQLTWHPTFIYWAVRGASSGFQEYYYPGTSLQIPPDTTNTMRLILFGGERGSDVPPTDPYTIDTVLTDVKLVPYHAAEKIYLTNIAYRT